jgi:hypothetical protein
MQNPQDPRERAEICVPYWKGYYCKRHMLTSCHLVSQYQRPPGYAISSPVLSGIRSSSMEAVCLQAPRIAEEVVWKKMTETFRFENQRWLGFVVVWCVRDLQA